MVGRLRGVSGWAAKIEFSGHPRSSVHGMRTQQGGRGVHNQVFIKGVVTAACALIFVAGLMLLLGELPIPQAAGADGLVAALLPLAVSAAGVFLLSWSNSHGVKKALLATAIVLILGVPLAFGILLPVTVWALSLLLSSSPVTASTSFAAAWFIILPPIFVELISGPVIADRRWARLIAAGALSFILILFTEFATESMVQGSQLDSYRLWFYAPVTWILIVFLVSPPDPPRHED